MPTTGRLALLAPTLLLASAGCAGGVTSTSFAQEEAKYDAFLQVELSAGADSAALVDEYAKDPVSGLARGGGDQVIVFLSPEATDEQVRELEARVRAEPGVRSVAVLRGVPAPPLELEVSGPPAPPTS